LVIYYKPDEFATLLEITWGLALVISTWGLAMVISVNPDRFAIVLLGHTL